MRFNAGTRTRLLWDVELDFDPTGSTLEVKVDDGWHPADWLDAPVHTTRRDDDGRTVDVWRQTGRTTGYFAGPDVADPDGATVLSADTGSPAGRHLTEIRVTAGGDVIVTASDPIDVDH